MTTQTLRAMPAAAWRGTRDDDEFNPSFFGLWEGHRRSRHPAGLTAQDGRCPPFRAGHASRRSVRRWRHSAVRPAQRDPTSRSSDRRTFGNPTEALPVQQPHSTRQQFTPATAPFRRGGGRSAACRSIRRPARHGAVQRDADGSPPATSKCRHATCTEFGPSGPTPRPGEGYEDGLRLIHAGPFRHVRFLSASVFTLGAANRPQFGTSRLSRSTSRPARSRRSGAFDRAVRYAPTGSPSARPAFHARALASHSPARHCESGFDALRRRCDYHLASRYGHGRHRRPSIMTQALRQAPKVQSRPLRDIGSGQRLAQPRRDILLTATTARRRSADLAQPRDRHRLRHRCSPRADAPSLGRQGYDVSFSTLRRAGGRPVALAATVTPRPAASQRLTSRAGRHANDPSLRRLLYLILQSIRAVSGRSGPSRAIQIWSARSVIPERGSSEYVV